MKLTPHHCNAIGGRKDIAIVWCKFFPFRTHRDDPHRHRDDLAEDGLNPVLWRELKYGVPTQKAAAIGVKAPYPGFIEPELATSVDRVPSGARWIHEIKFERLTAFRFISETR